ncbi:MAG: AMP-binding protein [Bacteroidota bacterium]|nr:AMP-binding protein [Bacteroidota bacterium]
MEQDYNLVGLFEEAIRSNWDEISLIDYGGESYTYREVGENIKKIHSFFKAAGISKGDKIALLGKNSAYWGILYLATITYGAVIVPLLPDFKPQDVQPIINHSDSVILFVDEGLYKNLDQTSMPQLKLILRIPDLYIYYSSDSVSAERISEIHKQSPEIKPEEFFLPRFSREDIAVISYTSGTTGFSKGVILQHRSLLGNLIYAQQNMFLEKGNTILSFLPMAHTFGCAFEFLFPFTRGCRITFLNKMPSPTNLITAFNEVRPSLILSVPLMIEKIFKSSILPVLHKPSMKVMIRIPVLNLLLYKTIRKKLSDFFGGNFKELVIGGAPLNPMVERFFRKIKFNFTVGYGMTECGPLISYASWNTTRPGASGRIVDELEMKIDSVDWYNIPGEILLRGSHVMMGYYKNEEATRAVLDPDGWLHTGDLATIDKERNIYIKGRSKSILLGPSGKNIYPEELESILNNRFMVMESLVVQRDNKLVALIYPDADAMGKAGVTEEHLPEVLKGYLHDLNERVPKYMAVSDFIIQKEEFEKTPKKNIKRFIYQ